MANTFSDKRIACIKDYDFVFTKFLGTETIVSAAIIISPTGLVQAKPYIISNGVVKVFLGGGVINITYTITVVITTSGGRIEELSPTMKVIA